MKDTGLTEKEWEQIRTVLRAVPAIEKAVLFGSRAMGLARGNSDVDIMLYGEELTMGDVAHARALLEETTLPYQFDLVLHDAENKTLQEHVRQYGKVIANEKSKESNWKNFFIDDIKAGEQGSIAIGPFGSRMKSDCYVSSGVGVVRGTNLSDGRRFSGEFVYIDKQKAIELGSANLQPYDLVFPHRGAIGEVGIVPDDGKEYVLSSSLMKLTCDRKKVDPQFLFYFFTTDKGRFELLKNASQVGTPGIGQPLTSLKQIQVLLPSIHEQRLIALFLSRLDDRIQILRETNATLEAMAQALFKSWFVDFDPVHAKAEGRAPEGMDAETAALFPDEFEESELGMIPKGWKVESLGTAFNLTMGQSPPGDTYNDSGDGVPFFQGRTDFGIRYPVNRKYCTSPTRIAQPNDTLISVRAPVGDINMAWKKCCIGRGVAAARHTSGGTSFTYYFLKSIQRKIAAFDDSGTVFGSITKKQFENIIILTPPQQLTVAFEQFVTAFDESIKMNTAKSRLLISLRDTLLPRLLSGKLRLPEFAEAVDEATA